MFKPKMRHAKHRGYRVFATTSALMFFVLTGTATAQQPDFRPQEGPYYVGEPVLVQIALDGFTGDEQVSARYGGSDPKLVISGPDVQQRRSSFTQWINGRTTSVEFVDYKFNFEVAASEEGTFNVGPFYLKVGSEETEVGTAFFKFEKLSNDPDMELQVSLGDDRIYVGEEVPLEISWIFSGDMNELEHAYARLQIRSTMFDQFEFRDKETGKKNRLILGTAAGQMQIEAEATKTERNGADAVKVSASRTMVAESPGKFKDIVFTSRTSRVTSWRRGVFGSISPSGSKPALAVSDPLSFTVLPLPIANRPPSFAGAVGTDFSISVATNRTVVRVGDPLSLDISLRGNGNLEKLSLPSLVGPDLLGAEQFQLPSEIPAGSFSGDTKQFKVNVRVKDESVSQLPPIAFSWFDPNQEKYVTAFSDPIPLEVIEANLVGASTVYSAANQTPSSEASASKSSSTLNFVGANLAIQKDATKLLASSSSWFSSDWLTTGSYVLGVGVVVISLVARRRINVDPEIAQQKQELKRLRAQIAGAVSKPQKEAAEAIAGALRQVLSRSDATRRTSAEQIISKCENLVYAPADTVPDNAARQLSTEALSEFDQLAKGV